MSPRRHPSRVLFDDDHAAATDISASELARAVLSGVGEAAAAAQREQDF